MNILRKLRKKHWLTLAKAAEIAGMNVRTYTRYEYGDCDINKLGLRPACRLAHYYKVPVESLLEEDADEEKANRSYD